MAGNYPDVPGHRMAIDKDGTIGVVISNVGVITQLSGAQMVLWNDELGGLYTAVPNIAGGAGTGRSCLIFPEARDLVGVFLAESWNAAGHTKGTIEVSTDTTTGLDGTWTVAAAAPGPAGDTGFMIWNGTNYRTGIIAISAAGARGIRINYVVSNGNIGTVAFHVYGDRTAGVNPNRLEIWQPVTNAKIGPAYLDWGNVPRGSSADKTFRVKNNSATLTANGINLTFDSLTDTTPSVAAQHLLSTDGVTFSASVNIGNLAPGAISSVVTVRKVTPTNAALALWALRLNATATAWV